MTRCGLYICALIVALGVKIEELRCVLTKYSYMIHGELAMIITLRLSTSRMPKQGNQKTDNVVTTSFAHTPTATGHEDMAAATFQANNSKIHGPLGPNSLPCAYGPVRLAYQSYFFSEITVFSSHNKSTNNTFQHGFSVKRTGPISWIHDAWKKKTNHATIRVPPLSTRTARPRGHGCRHFPREQLGQ